MTLEVEIGCGNGHFLAEYAARNPATTLIGVELKAKRCFKAQEKARKRRLANVTIVRCGAETYVRDLPDGAVDAFHIYFPDPWPKTRHRKRRFMTRENLEVLHSRLKPNGRILFSTDFFDYYLQTKILVLLHPGFSTVTDAHPPEAFSSVYFTKSLAAHRSIHFLTARKESADEPGEQEEEARHA